MAAAAALVLACCTTPYQRMGLRGGVAEQEIGPDAWLISAKGNGYTSRSTIVSYTYRRAGELCPGGFDVIDADRSTDTSVATFDGGRTYQQINKSDATLAVRCRPNVGRVVPKPSGGSTEDLSMLAGEIEDELERTGRTGTVAATSATMSVFVESGCTRGLLASIVKRHGERLRADGIEVIMCDPEGVSVSLLGTH